MSAWVAQFVVLTLGAGAPYAHVTVYVSPEGSDDNTGLSPSQPLATCQKAVSVVSSHPGVPVDVIFGEGTYPLTPSTACGTVTLQATRDAPVVCKARHPPVRITER